MSAGRFVHAGTGQDKSVDSKEEVGQFEIHSSDEEAKSKASKGGYRVW